MSKSIIVIDTPNTCSECLFNQIYNPSFCSDLTVCTAVKNRLFVWQDDKPKWCPLRPLPIKNKYKHDSMATVDYEDDITLADYQNFGWNACLEEIQNEENGM